MIRQGRTGRILAPRDLEAGGTWLGLNDRGVFVGLTNLRPDRFDPKEADGPARARPGLRSRGEVVMAALESRSAADAAIVLGELEEEAYNAFQLLVADEQEARLAIYRERPEIIALQPGVHVVGNVDDRRPHGRAAQPRVRKLMRVRREVEKLMTQADPGGDLLEDLAGICREHVTHHGMPAVSSNGVGEGATAFESTCVHAGEEYGTRSSLLLELAADREASRLWGTNGPPCEAPYEDLSPLLQALDVRSGPAAEAATEARTKR